MASSVEVREVRNGFFRVRFIFEDSTTAKDEDGFFHTAFQLCGSQSSRKFFFCYKFFFIKTNSDPNIATTAIYVREIPSNSNSEHDNDSESSEVNSSKRQKLASSVSETGVNSPHHMWIDYNNTLEETILFKKSQGVWFRMFPLPSNVKRYDAITLSIDFGNISGGLAKLFLSQQLCDVEFKFKCGQSIGAHVAILSAGSPVFSVMFSSGFLESKTRKVAIDDIEIDIFKQLLHYLYSGGSPELKVGLMENIIHYQHLFAAADKYDVEALKTVCVGVMIIPHKTFESATSNLIFSQLHSIPKLFEDSMDYFVKHSRKVCYQPEWLDFMKAYPELCVLVTQRIAGPRI